MSRRHRVAGHHTLLPKHAAELPAVQPRPAQGRDRDCRFRLAGARVLVAADDQDGTEPRELTQLPDEAVAFSPSPRRLPALVREQAAGPEPDEASGDAERDAARARVREILSRGAIRCDYQPIRHLPSRRLLGVEALARFPDPLRRGPADWFADAARAELTVELEMLAVQTALRAMPNLPDDAFLAINLSPATLSEPELVPLLTPHAPRLVLELSETEPVQDYTALSTAVEEFRAGGLRLAIDDAGAGYASLRHILRLKPDMIKLDMSLTRDLDTDPVKHALTAALATFAAAVDAHLVAEGIETRAELRALTTLGVSAGQGFFLGRPGPLRAHHPASSAG